MGQSGNSGSKTQETSAEMCIDLTQEEKQLPKVFYATNLAPSGHLEASLERLPPTALTDINSVKELQPVSWNHANATTEETLLNVPADDPSCSIGEEDFVANSFSNSEEVGGLLGFYERGESPVSAGSHVQEPSAGGQEAAQLKGDVKWVRDAMEARLNANTKEILKLNETLLQQWEVRIRETMDKKAWTLTQENQQVRARVAKLHSRVGLVSELQDTTCGMKLVSGQLRKIEKIFDQLLLDNFALKEDLSKCRTELASAIQSRISETKQIQIERLKLEQINHNLEQKVERIQQQLCKERAGQDGSYVDGQQTPSLLESTVKEMNSSIATFCAFLSKDSQVHSCVVGSDLGKKSRLAREHHWTYLLKHFISVSLFAQFESEKFVAYDSSVLFLDPEKRVSISFEYFKSCKREGALGRAFYHASNQALDYLFFEYLSEMSFTVLPPEMHCKIAGIFKCQNEFTSVRLNDLLSSLALADRKLFRSFVLAAEKVWEFHKLCLSFEPPATIFRVSSEDTFNQQYMESTDALETAGGNSVPTVPFMVYPGFRLRKSIIKCVVYVPNET